MKVKAITFVHVFLNVELVFFCSARACSSNRGGFLGFSSLQAVKCDTALVI